YAPLAQVHLVERGDAPSPEALFLGLDAPLAGYGHALVFESVEAYARGLYTALREADARGLARVDAQRVAPVGLGRALMDRLTRAAEA
ncbi:MAG: Sua5 family C-terminal domain-containing protein, partial [Bacteroidota bacterium]